MFGNTSLAGKFLVNTSFITSEHEGLCNPGSRYVTPKSNDKFTAAVYYMCSTGIQNHSPEDF